MIYRGSTGEYLQIEELSEGTGNKLPMPDDSEFFLMWFREDGNRLSIDAVPYEFNANQIVFLTEFHNIKIEELRNVRLIGFNRSFYCIVTHDSEVGCKGILFFGSSTLPVIQARDEDLEILETVWKMFLIEIRQHGNLQYEMLQLMLKRFLILSTRIYKEQNLHKKAAEKEVDIVREFNFLVEKHFKELHAVSEYARLLHRAPKTLSNIFRSVGNKTPLELINERIMVEARRMLLYTSNSVKRISFELGYPDPQTFSRFFKNMEGVPPSRYKEYLEKEKLPT